MQKVINEMLPFPLYLKDGFDDPVEHEGAYHYVLGGNGLHIVNDGPMFACTRKVSVVQGLQDVEASYRLKTPKLSEAEFYFIVDMFRAIYAQHKSECALLIYYHQATQKWYFRFPEQRVSGASVSYKMTDTDPWFQDCKPAIDVPVTELTPFGTTHSHAAMSAFFSGTDNTDDIQAEGINIVIGNVDGPAQMGRNGYTVKQRISVGGTNYDCKLSDVVEVITATFPPEYLPKIAQWSGSTTTATKAGNTPGTPWASGGTKWSGSTDKTSKGKGKGKDKTEKITSEQVSLVVYFSDNSAVTAKFTGVAIPLN